MLRAFLFFLLSLCCLGNASHSLAQSAGPPFGPRLVPQVGHTQEIKDIVYAGSGDFIVTAAKDNLVKIWTSDGRLLRTLKPHGLIGRIALNPNDNLIAVTTLSGRVELWSPLGKYYGAFPKHEGMLLDRVAFAPDQSYLVACDRSAKNGYCQAYNKRSALVARYPNPADNNAIVGLVISPDSQEIYLAAGHSIYKYSRSGELLNQFRVTEGYIGDLAMSPDGKRLATSVTFFSLDVEKKLGKQPLTTRVWSTEGALQQEFPAHSSRDLEFSKDNRLLLSGGDKDNRLLIHDLETGTTRSLKIGKYRDGSPAHIAIAPDSQQIITADHYFKPVNINIWRLDGSKVRQFNQATSSVINVDIDPVSGTIVTTATDNQIRYWSLDGRLLRRYAAKHDYPSLLAIAPNGRYLVTGGTTMTLWNGAGEELTSLEVHKRGARDAVFTPDGSYLLTGGIDGYVNMIALDENLESRRFKPHDGQTVAGLAVHPDSTLFATGSAFERFRIWDMQGKMVASFQLPKEAKPTFTTLSSIAFTPDGRHLVVSTGRPGQQIRFYNLKGELAYSIESKNFRGSPAIAISSSGKWLAAGSNKQIGIWDLTDHSLKMTLNGEQGGVRNLKFTPDEQHLISAGSDGSLRVWNLENRTSYAMRSKGDQWVVYSDDGYFDASRYGGDLLVMADGLKGYAVDQFSLYYNRPDIIYQRSAVGEDAIVDHFKSYYKKRLHAVGSDNGIASAKMNAPEVSIDSFAVDGKFVTIDLSGEDRAEDLAFLQIYVNDVPLYPGQGTPLSGRTVRQQERIELTQGKNKIEVSAMNASGIESLRAPLYVPYSRKTPGELYFVGLGVSNYRDPGLNLKYAHKDVSDLGTLLQRYRGHFKQVHTLPLFDAAASREAMPQVRDFLASATVDDTVILMVSGHGGYDLSTAATYYFLSYEANAETLSQTAISYDELESLLSGIKPRKKLLLLDTCESGEIDAQTLKSIKEITTEQGVSTRSRQRLARKTLNKPRPYLYTRDRYIYNNLARSTGAIVFSSSLANEPSLEFNKLENGIFTEALMRTLAMPEADTDRDGYLSIKEIETAVKSIVSAATRNLQHPNIERENIYVDFKLPIL